MFISACSDFMILFSRHRSFNQRKDKKFFNFLNVLDHNNLKFIFFQFFTHNKLNKYLFRLEFHFGSFLKQNLWYRTWYYKKIFLFLKYTQKTALNMMFWSLIFLNMKLSIKMILIFARFWSIKLQTFICLYVKYPSFHIQWK